ncbi:transglutaminase [Enterococcus silesiacus]|uniref:Transglutaminase n=1 Tax=Enterococcus silesiacus TaxID=332949 RepID=A0A0S3KAU4_9ENTE|nr:transglutaminase family protein [Enterococcus silesiacus]ALS01348.1 transglutaminase [Enterococcus silesiacus]OJG88607.1 transglutaminase [Enterococcus silesiacus]
MNNYLTETKFLDFNNKAIQNLIESKNWRSMDVRDKIQNIYNFIRDDIPFGFNIADELPASQILADGFGQCNTKGTLFMALLRANDIPCRIHAFLLDKKVQKGILEEDHYEVFPNQILHTWIEILYNGVWLDMEGFILDSKYFNNLQKKFSDSKGTFFGYGVGTSNLKKPEIDWDEGNTYIQKEGIVKDLGVYDSPDELLAAHSQNMSSEERKFYEDVIMDSMNKNIKKMRLL